MHRAYAHRGQRQSPLIFLLLMQIYNSLSQLPVQPPVTIALLAVNILNYMYPITLLGHYLGDIRRNCLLPSEIIEGRWYNRLLQTPWYERVPLHRVIFSSIIHVDDRHLYYNMLSLLWKGISLEVSMGSPKFLFLVVFSLLVSHSLVIITSYLLYINGYQQSGYSTCAVGFSAVLFSLKYVLNHNSSSHTTIFGITVPTKQAAWLELVITSVFNPHASFLGHLCGILAGILYVHLPILPRSYRYMDADGFLHHIRGYDFFNTRPSPRNRQSYRTYASYSYNAMRESEQWQEPETRAPSASPLDTNEIRNRRLNRFRS